MDASHDLCFRVVAEAPQLSQTREKRPRMFTSCYNCRLRGVVCDHVNSQYRYGARETNNTGAPCQFRDQVEYFSERSHIAIGTSADPTSSHSPQSLSSRDMEHSALPSPVRGDHVGASDWNLYLGVPMSSDGPHPSHYALTSPLPPISSSPRSNPDQSFAYSFFGSAPYIVMNDQTQQIEGVLPKLLHDFRPLKPPRPPERLHPTLSSWLKNMNKLSDLIDRLHELTSAAPIALRPQLHRQVATLRASFERRRERCAEFLRLTEEYANRYLLDISAEIQQQSSLLDVLEKRLDMARTLYDQAVDLRKSYELGTANAMKNARDTELSRLLPEDFDLFSGVEFALGEIQRCYADLEIFWTDEICRAVKTLKTRRVDPDDVKRWRGFKASLEQAIESWKMNCEKQDDGIWSALLNNRPYSSGIDDLEAILSTLSTTLSTLGKALHKVRESASVESSHTGLALILRVNLGFTQSSEMCLAFFRRCVDFGDVIAASSITFVAHPTFSRARASDDLQERVMALGTEAAYIPAENATQSQGSRKFNSGYAQCLSLQRRTTLELNGLFEGVPSWIVVADGLPDAPPGGFSLKLLHDLADTWVKERASIRVVLATLTSDPVEQLRYHSLSIAPTRPRFSVIRWIIGLVSFSS